MTRRDVSPPPPPPPPPPPGGSGGGPTEVTLPRPRADVPDQQPLPPPPPSPSPVYSTALDPTCATVGRRISGYLNDNALTLLPVGLAYLGGALIFVNPVGWAVIALALVLSLSVFVWIWAQLATAGASPGRRWAGYRLVDEKSHEAMGWGRALGYLVLTALLISLTFGIGALVFAVLAAGDPERRTPLDRALRLRTVRTGKQGHAGLAIGLQVVAVGWVVAASVLPFLLMAFTWWDATQELSASPDDYVYEDDYGYDTDDPLTDPGSALESDPLDDGLDDSFSESVPSDVADSESFTVVNTCGADGDGDCRLNVRSTASTDTEDYREYQEGDSVVAECLESGESVESSVLGTSSTWWARVDDGGYVAAIFLEDERGGLLIDSLALPTC